ncbi:MAG: PLP-dependent aspartate aminotransferase family protein [Alphaproteobacteria bacterium]
MAADENWSRRSQAARALGWIDQTTGALTPPIHPTSTFLRDPDNQYRTGYSYARDTNPTYDQAEALLCELEGGAGAMLFASGMAAAGAVFMNLRPGYHVLVPRMMYWGLRKWLADFAVAWGLVVEFVDMGDLAAIRTALRPGQSKLIWIETPANPLWGVSDIAAIADLAHGAGALLAVDSTVATPVLSQPLSLGADLVMHSATKYLNGHADMIGGVLICACQDYFWRGLADNRRDGGAILGTFEAWLLLRGMRTLFPRVEAACRNAMAVAEHFQGHDAVEAVLYPGLPSAPDHALAARQMQGGFGGMLSLRVRGGEARAVAVAANVKLWTRATSLGGVESLIEHRFSIEGPDSPVPPDLLRLSCGIEGSEDLIADLESALENSQGSD